MSKRKPKEIDMAEAIDYGPEVPIKPIVKGTRIDPRGDRVQGARLECECWLDRYYARGQLDEPQHKAGTRFRMAWAVAGLQPRVVGGYGERIGGRGDWANARLRAWELIREACQATGIRSGVVVDVCGLDQGAGSAKRIMWLKEALSHLALVWGLDRN
jgi:hypothetical protein